MIPGNGWFVPENSAWAEKRFAPDRAAQKTGKIIPRAVLIKKLPGRLSVKNAACHPQFSAPEKNLRRLKYFSCVSSCPRTNVIPLRTIGFCFMPTFEKNVQRAAALPDSARPGKIAARQVISELEKHILVDGFKIVIDLEKSRGSWLVDAA